MGHTTELESALFDISQAAGNVHDRGRYQKHDERHAFLHRGSGDHAHPNRLLSDSKCVEELVQPYGPMLIQKYRTAINPSLLVVDEAFFTRYNTHQKGDLDPTLIAAIYSLTLATEEGLQLASSSGLDVSKVEETAFRMFATSLDQPALSTVQAGLVLMQTPRVDSRTLNTQLLGIAFDLGLHVDSSTWMLTDAEHRSRKRLAWAVYVQDKWCSLIHGRPSLIPAEHWTVRDLVAEDYPISTGEGPQELDLDASRRGQLLFGHMVTLTKILATVLETFYTLKSMQEAADARENGTQLILERAKPVQIRLKNWFTQLPASLKMENSATGMPSAGKSHSVHHHHDPKADRSRLPASGILCHGDHPSSLHHPLPPFPRWRDLPVLCVPVCGENSAHFRHGLHESASSRASGLLLVLSVGSEFCSHRHVWHPPARDRPRAGRGRVLPHAFSRVPMDSVRQQSIGTISPLGR